MIIQQVMMFALAGHSVLGQVAPGNPPTSQPAPVAEAPAETTPEEAASPAEATDPAAAEAAPPSEAAPEKPEEVTSPTDPTPADTQSKEASEDAVAPEEVDAAAPEESASELSKVHAEFGKGVTISTADDQFSLRLRARMQLRAAYGNPNGPDNDTTQVLIRRARLLLEGNAYGPELTYYIQLGFSNRDTEPDLRLPLRDARVTYTALRDLSVQAGQMKVPYGRQRVVSSSAQQMVDRSIVVGELNLDRDVGAFFFSKDLFGLNEVLGYSAGVFGGDGRNRVSDYGGLLYVGRLTVTPFGSFDEFVESDISRDPKPRLSVAVGGAYNQNTNRSRSTFEAPFADEAVTFDYTHLGADFMFKWRGFFATGEWMLRLADVNLVEGVDEAGAPANYYAREAWGAYGQIGQMLTKNWEVSARYGRLQPLSETEPELIATQEMGGGIGYYFNAHSLKIQTDYFFYAFENDFTTGTHEARSQFQLFF